MAKLQRSVQLWIDRQVREVENHEQQQLLLLQRAPLLVETEKKQEQRKRQKQQQVESSSNTARRRGRSKSGTRGASTTFTSANNEDPIQPQHSSPPLSAASSLSTSSLFLTLSDLAPVSVPQAEADAADEALDNFALRYCRKEPTKYLHFVGRLLVMSELVALLTPCVAVGIQWITALCDQSPVYVMLELSWEFLKCLWVGAMNPTGDVTCDLTRHCIMRTS